MKDFCKDNYFKSIGYSIVSLRQLKLTPKSPYRCKAFLTWLVVSKRVLVRNINEILPTWQCSIQEDWASMRCSGWYAPIYIVKLRKQRIYYPLQRTILLNTSEEDIGICIWWDNGPSMPPYTMKTLLQMEMYYARVCSSMFKSHDFIK